LRKSLPSQAEFSKPVGIWIRVSTEDQAKGESPEHHEHRARAYAESKGWRVREVYHLEGVSGKAVIEHPEAQRMLAHVRAGHITGLIFSKLARLARNTRELLDFADHFRDAGADLISLQEAIDTSSPAGRLFFTVIAAMAQWEREEIAERVAASVPIRAKLGKPLGGAPPFGYRWEHRELVPDPQEAPVRRLVHELFHEHKRRKAVARILNERGYRTRNGSAFTDTTVERLLRDPTAKGQRRANYTRSRGQGRGWDLKPEGDWVLTPCRAIISEELWNACNAILDDRRGNGRPKGRPPVHLFAGRAFCACGQKLYVPSNSPKYVCQKCRNKIRAEDLDAVFCEQLRGFLLSPEEVAQYVDHTDSALKDKAAELEALEAEERRVRAEMDKTYRLYQADEVSVEGFGHLYRPLEERLKQLKDELPRLQGALDFLRIEAVSRDEVLIGAKDLADHWPDLTFEEKRQIVDTFVTRVEIGDDEVSFTISGLPAPSQIAVQRQRNSRGSLPPPIGNGPGSGFAGWLSRCGCLRPRVVVGGRRGGGEGTPAARRGRAPRGGRG
jgi:site-specific DNA recombinase